MSEVVSGVGIDVARSRAAAALLRSAKEAMDECAALSSQAADLAGIHDLVGPAAHAEGRFHEQADAAIELLESRSDDLEHATSVGWVTPIAAEPVAADPVDVAGDLVVAAAAMAAVAAVAAAGDEGRAFAGELEHVEPGGEAAREQLLEIDAYVKSIDDDPGALAAFFAGLGADHVDAVPAMLLRCGFRPDEARAMMTTLARALGAASRGDDPPEGIDDILGRLTGEPGQGIHAWDRLMWLELGDLELSWQQQILSANVFDPDTAPQWPTPDAPWSAKARLLGVTTDRFQLAFERLAGMPADVARRVLASAGSASDLVATVYGHAAEDHVNDPDALLDAFAAVMDHAARTTHGPHHGFDEVLAEALIVGGLQAGRVPPQMRTLTAEVAGMNAVDTELADATIPRMAELDDVPPPLRPLYAEALPEASNEVVLDELMRLDGVDLADPFSLDEVTVERVGVVARAAFARAEDDPVFRQALGHHVGDDTLRGWADVTSALGAMKDRPGARSDERFVSIEHAVGRLVAARLLADPPSDDGTVEALAGELWLGEAIAPFAAGLDPGLLAVVAQRSMSSIVDRAFDDSQVRAWYGWLDATAAHPTAVRRLVGHDHLLDWIVRGPPELMTYAPDDAGRREAIHERFVTAALEHGAADRERLADRTRLYATISAAANERIAPGAVRGAANTTDIYLPVIFGAPKADGEDAGESPLVRTGEGNAVVVNGEQIALDHVDALIGRMMNDPRAAVALHEGREHFARRLAREAVRRGASPQSGWGFDRLHNLTSLMNSGRIKEDVVGVLGEYLRTRQAREDYEAVAGWLTMFVPSADRARVLGQVARVAGLDALAIEQIGRLIGFDYSDPSAREIVEDASFEIDTYELEPLTTASIVLAITDVDGALLDDGVDREHRLDDVPSPLLRRARELAQRYFEADADTRSHAEDALDDLVDGNETLGTLVGKVFWRGAAHHGDREDAKDGPRITAPSRPGSDLAGS